MGVGRLNVSTRLTQAAQKIANSKTTTPRTAIIGVVTRCAFAIFAPNPSMAELRTMRPLAFVSKFRVSIDNSFNDVLNRLEDRGRSLWGC